MPLFELFRLSKEKLGSKEMNNTSDADQSFVPENDFFELFWENGQVSIQGQSTRAGKSSCCSKSLPSHCLPSHSPKGSRDKDVGFAATNAKMGKFGDLDYGLNEFPMSVPSGEVDLSQDEDVMPWLNMNYTMNDSLQHEYDSDFLHELPGVTVNELPPSNNFAPMDKRSNGNPVLRDTQKNSVPLIPGSEQGNVSNSKGSSAREVETSFASVRSRVSGVTENITSNATQHASHGEIMQIHSSSSDFSTLKMQKQEPIIPGNSSSTVMNFSHFARPAAIMRANLQSIGLSSARSESMGNKNKSVAATSSNPPESTRVVDSSDECPKESKADLKLLEPKSLEQNVVASKQSIPTCKEDAIKIDRTSNGVVGESGTKGQTVTEKNMEPAVASSSGCSGNGAEKGSDDPNQNLKRKSRDTEDSECHSEGVEDESVGVKKAGAVRGSTSSKRSRAAEVHNLSERRRRDRINEKMRALQELIPNCNKVDKASMLDEAIEYLKTLQLQVQIMSMGAGLYMPPMMLPTGMQHMHAPHMAAFSSMGVGMQMGLGMGYGIGMPDMNGGSSRFPVIQVPQMQGTHLPVASTALHGMARSNPQGGYALPGQGLSTPMPHTPVFSYSGGPLTNKSAPGLYSCIRTGLKETVDLASASASGLKDRVPNVNSQVKQSTGGCNSTSQMSTQCESTTVGFGQSDLVHRGQASEVNDTGAVNPGKEDR